MEEDAEDVAGSGEGGLEISGYPILARVISTSNRHSSALVALDKSLRRVDASSLEKYRPAGSFSGRVATSLSTSTGLGAIRLWGDGMRPLVVVGGTGNAAIVDEGGAGTGGCTWLMDAFSTLYDRSEFTVLNDETVDVGLCNEPSRRALACPLPFTCLSTETDEERGGGLTWSSAISSDGTGDGAGMGGTGVRVSGLSSSMGTALRIIVWRRGLPSMLEGGVGVGGEERETSSAEG